MAAKLLQSLTDDNLDLQKQIGCMTGIFQLFDRQHVLTSGRRIGHTPKRLPAGKSHSSNGYLERDSSNGQLRSASLEKYSNKNMQERQRVFTESSRASFSSSSRSSSFCSLDCNRTTQLEPTSFDGIIFPETPSRDSAMSLQDSSPHVCQQVIDLRHLVKDSMYREVQGSSVKAKSTEATDLVVKHRDSPRPSLKTGVGSHGLSPEKISVTPADFKESLRVLAKLQEAPWYHNEPRELLRSASYHSKDGSSFSVSKDLPRFSYDGRERNRAPDVSKSSLKLKDLPRLSLDSREGSLRSLKSDSKSNIFVKTLQKDSGEFDIKTQNLQQSPGNQARPPSVVAKLMGLETLPDSVLSSESNVGLSRSCQNEDFVNVKRSFANTDSNKPIQLSSSSSSSSKNLWKEPSSPRWRNTDSSMKPMSRFPIEPAPWKQTDGTKRSQKPASRSPRGPAKTPNTIPTVYSEIEKRLKDLEFTQSGKDLRALKQILESMQAKGLLETEKEGQGSNLASNKDREQKFSGSIHDSRSSNSRNSKTDQILASTKKRVGSGRNHESPIVIMKPAKLVEKSGIPAASVLSLDGFSGLPKNQDGNSIESKRSSSCRTSNDSATKSNQRENAVTPVNLKYDRISKAAQNSTSSQQSAKDNNASSGKSSGSISPRMQQKKAELEKRIRPPTTPPDSSKLRKQPNKQQTESVSPAGRRRPKNLNFHTFEEQPSEISAEPRNLSYHENENLVQLTKSLINESRSAEVFNSERSPSTCHRQYPSLKACELMVSGLAEKKSALTLNDEEAAELTCAPTEYSSPVSVLDNTVHKDDSSSPAKYVGKTLKEKNASAVQGSSMTNCGLNFMEMSITSEINRKKLQNIENLVQKLRRVNSSHDEARTDYIASLCENTDPDHRYISEILLASGLLLRDLGGSLANFQFHPSGHPINPDLFLVLEQTKASTLLKEERSNERTATQIVSIDKFHRKLIFDTVNEILTQRLALSEPWPRMHKPARKAVNAQKLLRDLCSEIEGLRAETSNCGRSDAEDDGWKNILCQDLTLRCESWTNFNDEITGPVLDIERLIFKDLVDEIVIGECTGLKTKSGRHRNHFSK